jgi:hypothetical protein
MILYEKEAFMTIGQFRAHLNEIDRCGYYADFLLYCMAEVETGDEDAVNATVFAIKNNQVVDFSSKPASVAKAVSRIMQVSRKFAEFVYFLDAYKISEK